MTSVMKKLINRPEDLARELLEGYVAAFPDKLRMVGDHIIVRGTPKQKGKVQIVIGQGSGHEPGYSGFVGHGMHDVEVAGQIFACAGPDRILEGIQEAHRISEGGEVLLVIFNHEGDVINGTAALEMARDEGINVDSILLYDDIASAPKGEEKNRRGMAGTFISVRIAGALAEMEVPRGRIIETVSRVNDNTRTLAVALRSCTVPTTGELLFHLADDEMIIGPGVHGEASREGPVKMMTANDTMRAVLDRLIEDGEFKRGDNFLVLLNGCGATTLMELFVMFRYLKEDLDTRSMTYFKPLVGNVITTQEMAGFSLSLCKTDAEIRRLWEEPADTPYFKVCKRQRDS